MSAELPRWLRDALPERLRADARLLPGDARSLTLQVGAHVIDVQLASEVPRAFVTHGPLSFGYRLNDGLDPAEASSLCEELAAVLAEHAAEPMVALLHARAAEPRTSSSRSSSPRKTMMLTEARVLRARALVELARAREVDSVEVFLDGGVCVQSCRFCAYPGLRARRDTLPARLGDGLRALDRRGAGPGDTREWLARIVAIMRERAGAHVTLSGPDCLRHPQIDAMLELLAGEPAIELELLGPLTRLAEPELARRVATIPTLRAICTSLLAARAEIHDAMVGTPGAHAQVLAALENCRELGIRVTVNVLIGPANVDELPALLELTRALGVANVSLCLYHPESANDVLMRSSWRDLDLAALVVGPRELARAWAAIPRASLDSVHAHNMPRCWVPSELRELLLRAPGDLQDNFVHPPACAGCRERGQCPGVTVPAAELLGHGCVEPIVS